jgi:hypothetical protein
MRQSVKIAVVAGALAIVGGLFLAGTSFADRGFGGHGHMGMMGLHHEMLKDIDANADGALSQQEIDSAIDARFSEVDGDRNGSLSLEEFQALWADITRPVAVRAFQFLDPDGDAAIAKTELDERFGAMVSRFDRNDDGALSPEDRPRHRGWHRWRGDEDGEGRE